MTDERFFAEDVQHDIEGIIRTFDAISLVVRRGTDVWVDGESTKTYAIVYQGEALIRPGSGTVDRYGLGQVENLDLVVLIAGTTDIRQGDFVTLNDHGYVAQGPIRVREFRVQNNPRWLGAFTQLELKQHEQ
jgi:hypothetical protein